MIYIYCNGEVGDNDSQIAEEQEVDGSIRYTYELPLYHISYGTLNTARMDEDLPLKLQSNSQLPECLCNCMNTRLVADVRPEVMVMHEYHSPS